MQEFSQVEANTLNYMRDVVYQNNVEVGWYTDPKTGLKRERNIPEMLMLIVSEVAEAMEGYRKDLMDDHLPHRSQIEAELADVFIRLCDLAGYLNLDFGGAVVEKHAYNMNRVDHKLKNRIETNGKKF